jgi:hypothetical protein
MVLMALSAAPFWWCAPKPEKSYCLTFIVEVILELGSVKRCVIGAKGFDIDIELPRSFLKRFLPFNVSLIRKETW